MQTHISFNVIRNDNHCKSKRCMDIFIYVDLHKSIPYNYHTLMALLQYYDVADSYSPAVSCFSLLFW